MDLATERLFALAEANADDTGRDEGYERGAPEWYVMWQDTFNMLKAEQAAEAEEERESEFDGPEHERVGPVDFDEVSVGDRLTFLTRDTGFGRSGSTVVREGEVVSVTAKSVTVRVTGPNPFLETVWERDRTRERGTTARLTRATWREREPMRARG